jgi:hypothetical protein
MNFFRSVVLIVVGMVTSLFGVFILTSITNDPSFTNVPDAKLLQTICFLVMLIGVVPFGLGIAGLFR